MPNNKTELLVVSSSGRKMSTKQFGQRLRQFDKTIQDLPNKIRAKLPNTFSAVIANRFRGFIRDNYIGHIMWKDANFTEGYAKAKDRFLERGDQFVIGALRPKRIISGSGTFGLRTGALYNFLSSAEGTEVKQSVRRGQGKGRGFDLLLGIRVKTEEMDGDYYQKPGGTDKSWKLTTENLFKTFSVRVTEGRAASQKSSSGEGETNSVLTRLTPDQLDQIRRYVFDTWRVMVRDVVEANILGAFN